MNFKIWQIAVGISLLVGLNGSQVALANLESKHLHQREWLVADLAADLATYLNDTSVDINTPEKEEWFTAFSRLQNFIETKNFKDALPIAEETIKLAEKTKDNTLIFMSYSNSGLVYQELGQTQQTIKLCNLAISSAKLVRKSKVVRLMEIMLLINLAELYNEQNDPKLALEALNSGSNLLDKMDKNVANFFKPFSKPTLLSLRGWAYNNAQNFSEGLRLTKEALQSVPEAEQAYQSIGENIPPQFSPEFRDYQRIIPLWQMGVAYQNLGQPEKACSVYKDTLSRVKQIPDIHLVRLIKKSIDDLSLACLK